MPLFNAFFVLSINPMFFEILFSIARSRLSFWVLLCYRKSTDFFVLGDNLFALNHLSIFCSSKFALVKIVWMFLSEVDMFVSLTKIMGSKALDAFFRSLMYKTSSNGPRIDPWRTSHMISWNGVFSFLLITTHCFPLLR